MLGQQVLPAAESAFEASRKVFEEGKGDYLNVLDAQRTLIGAREQYVAVLAAQIRAATQVEGLIGQPLATLTEADPADQETGHVD